jgi:uncharacterized protein
MIRAVFDTNIFFQAAISQTGPSFECWNLVLAGSVQVYMSAEIFAEIREVASRPKLRKAFPNLGGPAASQLLRNFRNKSIFVMSVESTAFEIRDPDDQKFLDLAVTVNAEYLVSRDRDLLDLHSDSEFSSQFPNLKIVTPVGFLEIVRAA